MNKIKEVSIDFPIASFVLKDTACEDLLKDYKFILINNGDTLVSPNNSMCYHRKKKMFGYKDESTLHMSVFKDDQDSYDLINRFISEGKVSYITYLIEVTNKTVYSQLH